MKLIYKEMKSEPINNLPFITVNAYLPEYPQEPPNMPALICIEHGTYQYHRDYPYKVENTEWKLITEPDLPKVIRKAIEILDKEYSQIISEV